MQAEELILERILDLQVANRNISEQELAKNIVLILLEQHSELNLSEVLRYLNCPQAYLTHLLKRMEAEKLLKVRQDAQDLRFRYFRLTKKGRETVTELDQHYDEILRLKELNFSAGEADKLAGYFKELCDAGGILAQIKRPNEHPIRPQQRRLAALLGVTGRQILNLKVSSTNFHLLRILHRYNGLMTIKDIAQELNIQSSQVSLLIKKFVQDKLVAQSPNPFDERSSLISLSVRGIATFEKYRKILLESIKAHLSKFSTSERNMFAELIAKFMQSRDPIKTITEAHFKKCRAQILELCYLQKMLEEVPATIAGPDNLLWMLQDDAEENPSAFAQVNRKSKELDLLVWKPGTPLYVVYSFMQSVLENSSTKPALAAKQQKILAKNNLN